MSDVADIQYPKKRYANKSYSFEEVSASKIDLYITDKDTVVVQNILNEETLMLLAMISPIKSKEQTEALLSVNSPESNI